MLGFETKKYVKVALSFFFVCLSGCGTSPLPRAPGLNYLVAPQIQLRVGRLEIAKRYAPPQKDPYVDHLFAMTPAVMVQQWARERFVPAGGAGHAVITVEDASVVEKRLPSQGGLNNLFASQMSERYDARVVVKIEIMDERGYPKSYARATATATRTVSDQMTLTQRQEAWTALMEDLMNRLNEEVEKNIKEYLSIFVVL
ncbi:MAG: hypothetical protein ACRCYZ_00315 [Alphaproteobacteria bacterium]